MKTLILTSCTGEKLFNIPNKLSQQDFQNTEELNNKTQQLSNYSCAAKDMYTGMQHVQLMNGILNIREHLPECELDLYIVSAGYGLLNENDIIVPYEVTFNNMTDNQIKSWSSYLRIHENLQNVVQNYDLIIFLLGDKYLKAIQLPIKFNEHQTVIYLCAESCKKLLPSTATIFITGVQQAKDFSYGLVGLKGYLFNKLSNDIVNTNGETLELLYNSPNQLSSILEKYKKENIKTVTNNTNTLTPFKVSLF